MASLLADSLHRLLSGPQRRSIPLMGAGLRHHHVASAAGSFEGRELNAAAPQPPLAAKITGFTSLPRRAMVTQRGCNVNRRWVSGHAILWRNWRQNSSILSTVLLVVFLVLYALLRTIKLIHWKPKHLLRNWKLVKQITKSGNSILTCG